MNAHDALTLAHNLIAQYPELQGWRVVYSSRMYRTLGLCWFRQKVIQLSLAHVLHNDEERVGDTIRHEIAHALVGPKHGHDWVWKAMALQVGAQPYPCDRLSTMPPGKWVAACPNCKRGFHRYRRPRPNRKIWCRACGPEKGELLYFPNISAQERVPQPLDGKSHDMQLMAMALSAHPFSTRHQEAFWRQGTTKSRASFFRIKREYQQRKGSQS